jgi:hypothetical protein
MNSNFNFDRNMFLSNSLKMRNAEFRKKKFISL